MVIMLGGDKRIRIADGFCIVSRQKLLYVLTSSTSQPYGHLSLGLIKLFQAFPIICLAAYVTTDDPKFSYTNDWA